MRTTKQYIWNKPGIPHKGWRCLNIEDIGEPEHTCEMCGREEIRHVHTMQHHNHPHELLVGCVCASRMEIDPKAAQRRVNKLKGVKQTWVRSGWKANKNNNPQKKDKGFTFVIFKRDGGFKASIRRDDSRSKDPEKYEGPYETARKAKSAAYDYLCKRLPAVLPENYNV